MSDHEIWSLPGDDLLGDRMPRGEPVVEDAGEDVFLVLEDTIQQGAREPGPPRNVVERGLGVPEVEETPAGGAQRGRPACAGGAADPGF